MDGEKGCKSIMGFAAEQVLFGGRRLAEELISSGLEAICFGISRRPT
jgi:hypothetical protein